jgi:Tol biopolymer transport system component
MPPSGAALAVAYISFREGQLHNRALSNSRGSAPYVMDFDGGNQRRLTETRADEFEPKWSPDGSMITFVSERDGNHEIYIMRSDGSDPQRLTNNPARDFFPAWSPDGTKIVFASWRDGNAEIYVVNADGTDLRNLTNNQADDFDPDWGVVPAKGMP